MPFVLWFNTLAGFAYIVAGIGLRCARPWAARLAWLIAIATLIVFVAFAVHVAAGGSFEMRTVGAITLRSLVCLAIAWLGSRRLAAGPFRPSPSAD